jgi:hypothetical protein
MQSLALSLLFTLLFYGQAGAQSETIGHTILSGSLHSSGTLSIGVADKGNGQVLATIRYNVKPRMFVPVSASLMSGSVEQLLPANFVIEDGYLDMEKRGSIRHDGAVITHLGRANFRSYYDCHKVRISPRSGKWEAVVLYHPDVKGVGWVKIDMVMKKISLIGSYAVSSELR